MSKKVGRPAGTKNKFSMKDFYEAIRIVELKQQKALLVHFVEQAYIDNKILIALMKKILPDKVQSLNEEDEELIKQELEFKDVPQNGDGEHRFSKFVN